MRQLVRRLFESRNGYGKLIALGVWWCFAKVLAAIAFTPAHDSIFNISFGFGGFIQSLDQAGRYASCTEGICTYATRMPAQPLFFAAIGLVTTNMLVAAIIKVLVLTLLVAFVFCYLVRLQTGDDSRKTTVWFFIALVLVFAPPVIKHAANINYEEGFLIELLFLWTFAFLVAVRQLADREGVRRHGVVVIALVLSASAYLFKSSMIAVFALTLVLAAVWFFAQRSRRVLVTAVLCLVPMAAWAFHNVETTHHFSVLTSFDGQNSYRGQSDESLRMYPQVDLDRIFDSTVAYKPDGERIDLVKQPDLKSFGGNEWAMDAYYKAEAKDWALDHPGKALEFTGKKIWNFFGGIRETPYTHTADARNLRTSMQDLATSAWLLAGRVMWVAMIALMVALWRRRDRVSRWLCAAVVATNATYAAPYIVGFNYERHVTTYLVMVAACLAVLLTEFLEKRSPKGVSDDAAEPAA